MKVTMKSATTRSSPVLHWSLLIVLLCAVALVLSSAPPVAASEPIEVGYAGPTYPGSTGGNGEPTGEKPESKLWWNDGYWWASMWSNSGNAYHIFKLNLATKTWEDTDTQLDPRNNSRADVLWDGNKLYVASHVFAKNGGAPSNDPAKRGKLFRYSYDSGSEAYSLDDDFPAEITGGVSETLVLEKDANGKLWVTYVEDEKVMVNRSLNGDDAEWGDPFALPFDEANVSDDDISSIITYNQHVGIMWSNQDSGRKMYFAVHNINAANDTDWSRVLAYGSSGDDHISLKSLETDTDGHVYAVIKTSRSAELIMLLVCERNINRCRTQDDWTSYQVYDGEHSPTRPILLIDTSNRQLYVFSRNKDGGHDAIYYKRTGLDNIQFDVDSIGMPFIKSADDDGINDPTSTKQNLTSTTGLVVLASDSGPDRYFYNYMSLSGSSTKYNLTVNKSGQGSVTLDPPGGEYDENTTVSLTATPDPGWQFSGWSGDLNGTDNQTTIFMNSDKTVTATFTQLEQYELIVNTVGNGSVTPSGGTYYDGTEVTLTATPDPGWQFDSWGGAASGTDLETTVLMDGDKTVTANFSEIPQYTLTVNVNGEGSVALDPSGGTYYQGTEVELEAVAVSGWEFSGWSGALTGDTNPTTIIMDGDKTVTATFTEIPQHSLTVIVEGQGSVTPDGGVYEDGTEVTLTATPDPGWEFDSWSGAASGTDPETKVVMSSDKMVTATFSEIPPAQYTLTVNTVGNGSVTPNGGTYEEGTKVTLTATADPGWQFDGWSGAASGTDLETTVTMDGDKTVTATFSTIQRSLNVTSLGGGNVSVDPPGGVYDHGTTVTLSANPDPGWTFSSWSGDLEGTDNPATITMDADKDINATFVQKETGIQIEVSARPMTATVGQVITYTYVVANIGEATLNDIAVVDDRLGAVTLDKTTLASGETAVGRLTYSPVVDDLPGPLENSAIVTATSVLDEEVSDSDTVSVALRELPFTYYLPLGAGNQAPVAMRTGNMRLGKNR